MKIAYNKLYRRCGAATDAAPASAHPLRRSHSHALVVPTTRRTFAQPISLHAFPGSSPGTPAIWKCRELTFQGDL